MMVFLSMTFPSGGCVLLDPDSIWSFVAFLGKTLHGENCR
jgi:hypothetical protein